LPAARAVERSAGAETPAAASASRKLRRSINAYCVSGS
jgi:hypothetical protein